jgi:MoaA/NifB/PqqE/SkfB family radical SAM enzyme
MYSRTKNENGTCNTRCLHCFMTIASCVETDTELDEREARHICPERALAKLRELEASHGPQGGSK